ncbi:unnamed protein product [Heterobilharzia americana]|nr:unnamed protein product [Heterobilharzia americana]
MNGRLMPDSESAPGGPCGRQPNQLISVSQKIDTEHPQKSVMPMQQYYHHPISPRRLNYPQQHSYDQQHLLDSHHFQCFPVQSELKYNYSDESSSFYQPTSVRNYQSNHQTRVSERLPKHKYLNHPFHQKLLDPNLSILLHPQNQSNAPTEALFSGAITDDELLSSQPPPPPLPPHHILFLPSSETAFKPINHQYTERNASSSQSIHECNSEIIDAGRGGSHGCPIANSSSRSSTKMNSTPNLLDHHGTTNTTVNTSEYFNPLLYKHRQLQMQMQNLKHLQQQDKYQARLPTLWTFCGTTKSTEELLKRQKKLDHLQYCLQRYEIEREEAGQAICRIEERMQELEARATDLLEFDISKNLNDNNRMNSMQQHWGTSSTDFSQAEQLPSNDEFENHYISWLQSIENTTNTLKTPFLNEHNTSSEDIYTQNNYMYIEPSLNDNTASSNQPKQHCSLGHSFNSLPLPSANGTALPGNNNSPESKRNLLLEHLMIQRQRLATADASVTSLAKRLMLLNSNSKLQQDVLLNKPRKLSYSGNPTEQNTSMFHELTDNSAFYNKQAISSSLVESKTLRNSKHMSSYANPVVHSEGSGGAAGDDGIGSSTFQSRFIRSLEDDILIRAYSTKNKQTAWQKSSTIERTNGSSVQYLLDSPQLKDIKLTSATRKLNETSFNYLNSNSTTTINSTNNNTDSSIITSEFSALLKKGTPTANNERQKLPTPIRTNSSTWCTGTHSQRIPQVTQLARHQRASENGYIELANTSSSPVPEDDYTTRLLRETSKTQLPSRRYFNTNAPNNSMTGFLTPVNCPLATAQLLSCSDKTLPRQSSPFVRQQVQQLPHPPPPLPPKPSQINPKTSIDSQEHLSAEDEEVFKFMSRSFDPNDELSSDFQVKAKRYIKQKSEYAFNLREFLKTLHHPVDDLAVKTSDTTALPQSNSGICLTSILGNWITLRTSRAQKPLPAEESLDYFQCKIILTGRICGGYLWIMKKPSRTRNNIWESIKRRVHDSSSTQSTNGENEKINKRIIIRSTSQARWCRKWLSCDMLEQKIFICERKGNGRIDCTINFSIIKVVHQRSTEQLLDSQKSFSLSPRISQRTLYSLVSTDNNNKNDEKGNSESQDSFKIMTDNNHNHRRQQSLTLSSTTTATAVTTITTSETDRSDVEQINCTEKTETFFCLETTLHTYFLMAPSPELTRLWMDVLKQGE